MTKKKSKSRKKNKKKFKSRKKTKNKKKTKSRKKTKNKKKTKSVNRITNRKSKSLRKTKNKKTKLIKKKNSGEEELIIKVPKHWAKKAYANKNSYQKKYNHSIKKNEDFWRKEGKRITWIKSYKKIKDVKFSKTDLRIKWFYDGKLNASSNCIDRHLKKYGKKTAIIWVGDDPSKSKEISYRELHKNVCKTANALKSVGIQKGDRVTIYLSMIPELA
jgi:acetyl-CoA synthetase